MRADLEERLWQAIRRPGGKEPTPREVIAQLIREGLISDHEHAWRTLARWRNEGRYVHGTSIDLGWKIDDEAKEEKR